MKGRIYGIKSTERAKLKCKNCSEQEILEILASSQTR